MFVASLDRSGVFFPSLGLIMRTLNRLFVLALGTTLVVGFSVAAIYVLLLSVSDPEIARRGGYWSASGALGLALLAFIVFRAIVRSIDQQR